MATRMSGSRSAEVTKDLGSIADVQFHGIPPFQDPAGHLQEYLAHLRGQALEAMNKKMSEKGFTPLLTSKDIRPAVPKSLGFIADVRGMIITWRNDLGAHWIGGEIAPKYYALGGPGGALGFPKADDSTTTDHVGRFVPFEGGRIYWHPTIGAFALRGKILKKWLQVGAEAYGYPTADESSDGVVLENQQQTFRWIGDDGNTDERIIYWSVNTGACEVQGAICARWVALGKSTSYLLPPTTDEADWINPETGNVEGRLSVFERGSLVWIAETGEVVEYPDTLSFESGHIGVSSIGGWCRLVICSSGEYTYSGHLHNSGVIGLHCTVACGLKIPGTTFALTDSYDAGVGGEFSFDSRNEDWSTEGFHQAIGANWDALKTATQFGTVVKANLGPWEVVTLIILPLVGAVMAISLLTGGGTTQYPRRKCHLSRVYDPSQYPMDKMDPPPWAYVCKDSYYDDDSDEGDE